MRKIIHIASDEKFINSAQWQFSCLEEVENVFYIIVNDTNKKLKHVDLQENMVVVLNTIKKLKELGRSITGAQLVCFHGLDYHSSVLLNSLPSNQKILWILFGKEIYNNPCYYSARRKTGNRTFNTFLKKGLSNVVKNGLKNSFRGLLYKAKNGTNSPAIEIKKAMKRSNYCGILYAEEFDLVKRLLKTEIQHVKFSYYPIEKMVENTNTTVSETNILLGNSASYTNNHLEAFDRLKRFNLEDKKVITPLSYGDSHYANKVIKIGGRELDNNFEPLVDFMPLHEYNKNIQSCGIVIMNHYRQQAVGNVLTMIWMGAKVYLDDRNTMFRYLKRIGIHVFNVGSDLTPENKNAFTLLTREEQVHNRECLKREITEEVLLKELQTAVSSILCP